MHSSSSVPRWDRTKRVVDLLSGIAVIATLGFIARQWHEMHEGGKDTHDLAVAAKAQADAAKAQADNSKAQVDRMGESLQKTSQLIAAATIQAKATNKLAAQAQRSADTAQEQLINSERPWANAEALEDVKLTFTPPGLVVRESQFTVFANVAIKNTGSSVASNGIAFIYAEPNETLILMQEWDRPCETVETQKAAMNLPNARKYGPWPVGFVLTPGDTTVLPEATTARNISYQEVLDGMFYILGCASYRDHFGIAHRTRFCFQPTTRVTDLSRVTFRICNAFQEAD